MYVLAKCSPFNDGVEVVLPPAALRVDIFRTSFMEKRKITPHDLMSFQFLGSPCISPNGDSIIFTVSRPIDSTTYKTQIWSHTIENQTLLFEQEGFCSNLSWAPDGSSFAFTTSNRDSRTSVSRLWVSVPVEERKKCILEIPRGKISNLKWFPDSESILFISNFGVESAERKSDVKVIDRMQYRYDGEGFFDNRRNHLFKITNRSKNLEKLTQGEFDVQAFDISHSGDQIAFISNLDQTADFEINQNVYLLKKPSELEKLTDWKGVLDSLSFSPNDQHIAFVGHDYSSKYNTPHKVHVLNFNDRMIDVVTDSFGRPTINSINTDCVFGRSIAPPIWLEDSQTVLFSATVGGTCHIYSVDITSKKIQPITKGKFVVTDFSASKSGKIAFTKMDPLHLPELFVTEKNAVLEPPLKLTQFNDPLLSTIEMSYPEQFVFKARDGATVEGWFYRPIKENPDGPFPCVVEIHGGGSTEGYEFMHEFQCLCSQGFAVLTCNFRGTRGYDQDFVDGINGHYMEKDYQDIIDMVRFALGKKWIDRDRLAIAGGSYGGWLTSWIIGHETSKFAAAITDRSVVNLISFYGTSDDYRTFEQTILGCLPWENTELYLEKSVLSYAQNITTPLLIIHSEEDYRCPISEAEQLFAYLKRQGKEVLFVRFPHEGHGLSRDGLPHHRIERLGFYLWWLTSHIETGQVYTKPE